MRKSVRVVAWAVYQSSAHGEPGPNVVCTQAEWEAALREQPGACRLIKDGITNEGEAERLARGASGEIKPRPPHRKAVRGLPAALPVLALLTDEGQIGEVPAGDGPVILPFSDVPEAALKLSAFDETPGELKEPA